MRTGTITGSITIGGMTINTRVERSEGGAIAEEATLPAGKAGTLGTRTDDNTGVITLSAGHGLVTGNVVDVYWTGGIRYGMALTVDGNEATVDGGAGEALPAQGTAVVVGKQIEINVDFDGDDLEMLVACSDKRAHVDFQDSASASLLPLELLAEEAYQWSKNSGHLRPITGNEVDKCLASCGTTADAALQIAAIHDNTPS